ncbi:MAG: cupin domain-containing protein [Hyphomicrobiaceae bacterium]
MAKPQFTRMYEKGLPGAGLEDWGTIPAESLTAGSPQQRGMMVLDDKERSVTAGVWECTAFTGRMGPYSCDEFMLLLEGSVTIVDEKGGETVINAGESFVLPKGLVCQWKQTGYVRKFFVIYEDNAIPGPKDATGLAVIKPDPKATLQPADGPDPALIVSGKPVWHDLLAYEDPTGQFTVGLWSTTPYERRVIPFPRHEMMHILEGEVTISDGEGRAETFKAGDTLFVPQGAMLGWRNDKPVKKIYCIFLPRAAAAKSEAAE